MIGIDSTLNDLQFIGNALHLKRTTEVLYLFRDGIQ